MKTICIQFVDCLIPGLDEVILPYVQCFLDSKVTGKQLLFLNHSDLCKLGVVKLGHRELILEAVEMLHTLVSTKTKKACKPMYISLLGNSDLSLPKVWLV